MSKRFAALLIIIAIVASAISAHAQTITVENYTDLRLLYTIMCGDSHYQMEVQGETLVYLCEDKIQLWDVQNFQPLHSLTSKSSEQGFWGLELTLSPDGRVLTEWSYQDNIYLWDTVSGQYIGEIPVVYNEEVNDWVVIRFSADSSHLVMWRSPNTFGSTDFEVWSMRPFQQAMTFTSRNGVILDVAFSRDNEQVYALTTDQVYTLTANRVLEEWDVTSGELRDSFGNDIHKIVSCAGYVAALQGGYSFPATLFVFEPNSLQQRWAFEFPPLETITIEGCSGSEIVLNQGSYEIGDTLHFWDAASGEERLSEIPIDSDPTSSYSLETLHTSPNGSLLMPPQCGTCSGESIPFFFVDTLSGERLASLDPTPELLYVDAKITADRLVIKARDVYLIYGIPDADHPANVLVPGYIMPSDINLRAEPSLEGEVIGFVETSYKLISGRDESGDFLYLENVAAKESGNPDPVTLSGWVSAKFVDLGDIVLEELPLKN